MKQSTQELTALPQARSQILEIIKRSGEIALAELASALSTTKESARQHLLKLEQEGWIKRVAHSSGGPGRPYHTFQLTLAGEHLFTKNYDELALQLIGTLVSREGNEGLRAFLAALTDRQVEQWSARLEGKSLAERIEALKGFYFEEDPFTSVIDGPEGPLLVEQNCPYYNVAMEHPAMCSITISTLTRLLGVRVKRVERFQTGNPRCVFQVLKDSAVDTRDFQFEFEEAPDSGSGEEPTHK